MPADTPTILATSGGIRAGRRTRIAFSALTDIVAHGVDVGRLDVEEHDAEVFLALIELAPEHQGRGIGSQLIAELRDRAFTDGKRVRLSVLGVNRLAYHLYLRLGFTGVSREGVAPEVRIRMMAEP